MNAYKFTKREYYDRGTFRLGTLYDYRREETYGSAIGDKREGGFDRKHSYDFKTTDSLVKRLTADQQFAWMYAKGKTVDEKALHPYVLNFISANMLVFSASLVPDDALFDQFSGADCCVEIDDFESFGSKLVQKLGRRVEKHLIRECVYDDRTAINSFKPMPLLPFLKDRRYEPQKEIRVCAQYYGDPTEPITVRGLALLGHCRLLKIKKA